MTRQGAAFFEIAGCFAFWSYFRHGRPAWTLGQGVLSLVLFAYALTRVDAAELREIPMQPPA